MTCRSDPSSRSDEQAGRALAEVLNAPVWAAPSSERAPFPEDHPLYLGGLPFAMGPLSNKLQ